MQWCNAGAKEDIAVLEVALGGGAPLGQSSSHCLRPRTLAPEVKLRAEGLGLEGGLQGGECHLQLVIGGEQGEVHKGVWAQLLGPTQQTAACVQTATSEWMDGRTDRRMDGGACTSPKPDAGFVDSCQQPTCSYDLDTHDGVHWRWGIQPQIFFIAGTFSTTAWVKHVCRQVKTENRNGKRIDRTAIKRQQQEDQLSDKGRAAIMPGEELTTAAKGAFHWRRIAGPGRNSLFNGNSGVSILCCFSKGFAMQRGTHRRSVQLIEQWYWEQTGAERAGQPNLQVKRSQAIAAKGLRSTSH
ncbi:MAG: hypothetical protein FRX49_07829 [Trebouxia sp. A1-2]|nr:MAG: hypothetical protein FRX49_07829 [Trebouxia sp. A1-2]